MEDSQEKKQKRVKKLLEVAVKGEEAILDSIFELEDKLDSMPSPERGEKGDKGDRGEKGDKGDSGEQGTKGEKGDKGDKGDRGNDGKDGSDGLNGKDGENGKDGSPDTPEDIKIKLESLKDDARLDAFAIKNLPKFTREIVSERMNVGFPETPLKAGTGISITTDGSGARIINSTVTNPLDGSGTANELTYWVDSDTLGSLTTATYPSLTELSYVKGVTSAIQTQINAKFTLPSLTAGSVLFSDGSTISQDNSNFFWDNTNKQLKIGSNSIVNGNSLNPIAIAKTSTSYLATYIQNLSSGTAASTDLIIGNNADDGTVSTGTYLDMGINSSGYTGSGLTNGPGDAYIFNNLEDLIIGTGTAGKNVIIGTNIFGGSAASKTRATFTDTGLQMMDGTAANPSIAFAGSTTTGFYEVSAGILGTSIAGVNRLSHSATSWDLNSSNGGAVSIGGTSQYIDMSGTIVASAATFQGLRTTNLIWDMQVNRTNSFGLNNANTIGGSTGSLTLTTMTGARSGNVTTGTIGVAITTSNAFEAREFNNGSGGTVTVTNNFAFNASQNMTVGTAVNASFAGATTANAVRWNLYMSGTAQNWLEGSTGVGINIPLAKLHVVQTGTTTPVQRLSSTATNDDPTEITLQSRVATTNATVTTLGTIASATGYSYLIKTRIVARRTGGAGGAAGDYATYEITASANNEAGTLNIDATTTTVIFEDQAGWDAIIDASGTDIRIRVTGAASNNITWHATTMYYLMST